MPAVSPYMIAIHNSGLTRAHDREAHGKYMVSKWGREVRIYCRVYR